MSVIKWMLIPSVKADTKTGAIIWNSRFLILRIKMKARYGKITEWNKKNLWNLIVSNFISRSGKKKNKIEPIKVIIIYIMIYILFFIYNLFRCDSKRWDQNQVADCTVKKKNLQQHSYLACLPHFDKLSVTFISYPIFPFLSSSASCRRVRDNHASIVVNLFLLIEHI